MSNCFIRLFDALKQGEESILITVIKTKGSSPREVGARMIVSQGEIILGTIGGGHLEYKAFQLATRRLSSEGQAWNKKVMNIVLGENLGQCCGGAVDILFEVITEGDVDWLNTIIEQLSLKKNIISITSLEGENSSKGLLAEHQGSYQSLTPEIDCSDFLDNDELMNDLNIKPHCQSDQSYFIEMIKPSRLPIVIFGAGHVGKALVKVLLTLDCDITWIDAREEQFPDNLPESVVTTTDTDYQQLISNARSDAYFLVMTHRHSLDLTLCELILKKNDFRYCGLIGSKTKSRKFQQRLLKKSLPEALIDRLTCPIGIEGIKGKAPEAIAISVVAEILIKSQ